MFSSVHTKTQTEAGFFKFLRFEKRFRNAPFSGRIRVDGRPNQRKKVPFQIPTALCERPVKTFGAFSEWNRPFWNSSSKCGGGLSAECGWHNWSGNRTVNSGRRITTWKKKKQKNSPNLECFLYTMDKSSLPATSDPRIHNEIRDHTAVYEPAAIKSKETSFHNVWLCNWLQRKTRYKKIQPIRESIPFFRPISAIMTWFTCVFPRLAPALNSDWSRDLCLLDCFMSSVTSVFYDYSL